MSKAKELLDLCKSEAKDSRPEDEIIVFRSGDAKPAVDREKKQFRLKMKKKLQGILDKTTNLEDKDKATALRIIPKIADKKKLSLKDALKSEYPLAKVGA